MKHLLISLGKSWSVIRREGVWKGGQRVLVALGNLIPRRLSGDILIIASGVGDSARYRGEHVGEELRLKGFHVAVTTQYNPLLPLYAKKFSVFIFHRTLVTGKVAQLFERAKKLEKTVIFETDDLVYDPQYITETDLYRKMNALEKKLYEHGVGGEILADPAVAVATTTTSYLADKLREQGKRVFVVPNKLSQQDLDWANVALQEKQSTRNQKLGGQETPDSRLETRHAVRIGYLSGTPSHNRDFATITPALLRLLERYPKMRLVLAGPLETESALQRYADRIERLPFVPRAKLWANIASLDINLAPLEIGNPFCESKSELKFFEAGIVRVPTVAAATRTFREAITDGVDGFVATSPDEWYDRVSELIEQPAVREEMGARAYETALERYTTVNANNPEYYEYLRSKISPTI